MGCPVGIVAAIIPGDSGFALVQAGRWFRPACSLSPYADRVQSNGANNPCRHRICLMCA